MDYQQIYDQLIQKAKLENRKKLRASDNNYIYYEQHHIIPRCMGGLDSKDNLVCLTPEEHYLAHLLLMKIHPDNYKLALAVNKMNAISDNQGRTKIKHVGWVKRKIAEANSKNNKGRKRKPFSNEHRRKIGDAHKGRKLSVEHKRKIGEGGKGRIFSEEHRKNMSNSLKNQYKTGERVAYQPSEEQIRRFVEQAKQPQSKEHIRKRTAHRKGQPNFSAGKAVICIELNREFRCMSDAASFVKIKHGSDIMKVCKGVKKSAGGYTWRFKSKQ